MSRSCVAVSATTNPVAVALLTTHRQTPLLTLHLVTSTTTTSFPGSYYARHSLLPCFALVKGSATGIVEDGE